jgi:hypothetical protein
MKVYDPWCAANNPIGYRGGPLALASTVGYDGGMEVSAIIAGVLAILMTVAGGRWLIIESKSVVVHTHDVFGIEFSLGQALMAGAAISAAASILLGLVARWGRRSGSKP